MKALVEHLVKHLVARPELVRVNAVEGEASILLELSVHPADLAAVKGIEGQTITAIRTVLSAAAGRRKAVLELVEPTARGSEE